MNNNQTREKNKMEPSHCLLASGGNLPKNAKAIVAAFDQEPDADGLLPAEEVKSRFHTDTGFDLGETTLTLAKMPKKIDVMVLSTSVGKDGQETPCLIAAKKGLSYADALAEAQKCPCSFLAPATKFGNKTLVAGIVAAAALIVIIVGAALVLFGGDPQADTQIIETVLQTEDVDKVEKSAVKVEVKAEGAGSETTKVKVLAVDKDNKVALSEREIEANKETVIGKLPAGEYDLFVTAAPVCDDGSTYKLPEKPIRFTVKGDGLDVTVSAELEKLVADEMTKEQLEEAAAALEAAGKQEAADKAREASESAESLPGSDSTIRNVPSTDGVSDSDSDDGTQPPSHTHSWVEQTTTVHHNAQYKVVHHDAVYDTVHHDAVEEYRCICNWCGADITGDPGGHMKQSLLNGGNCGSYSDKPVVVQQAYDEQVLVQDAWDEEVLVSAEWDEEVVTGYICSGCGETK